MGGVVEHNHIRSQVLMVVSLNIVLCDVTLCSEKIGAEYGRNLLPPSPTLRVEATDASENLVPICQTT